MFVQVIKGKVNDVQAMREGLDRWLSELAPGANGWLGATGGFTDDGTYVGVVRFESEEAARRNSDRPEQGAWWSTVEPLFSGPVEFHDCTDVYPWSDGGSDDAGFVQVMQGRVKDAGALKAFNDEHMPEFEGFRPDVIGGITAFHGDGGYTDVIYFTSEAEAREGEKKEMPAEMSGLMEEMMALYEGEPTYYDLKEPWLASPK